MNDWALKSAIYKLEAALNELDGLPEERRLNLPTASRKELTAALMNAAALAEIKQAVTVGLTDIAREISALPEELAERLTQQHD